MTGAQKGPNLPPWDLVSLREYVGILSTKECADNAWNCAQSVLKRIGYMQYHYGEARDLVTKTLEETDKLDVLVKYVFPNFEPEAEEFRLRKFKAEAHTLAFVQSGHSVLDTLGHVIFYSLNLSIPTNKVSIHTTLSKLPSGQIKDAVQEILVDPDIIYLSALVNHSKHRSIIAAPMSISFVDDNMGLKFQSFEFRGITNPERWVVQFLKDIFDRLQYHVLTIGSLLNNELSSHIRNATPRNS